MAKIKENIIGKRYGKLIVLYFDGVATYKCGTIRDYVVCKCDCGRETRCLLNSIKNGHTSSCGCIHSPYAIRLVPVKGIPISKIRRIWNNVKYRVTNEDGVNYKNYGERGIKMCVEWDMDLVAFYNWCVKTGWRKDLQIDRINVDGDYEPSNCRWVTDHFQRRNKRETLYLEYEGVKKPLIEWCDQFNIPYNKIYRKYKKGRLANELFKIKT
jgi:hypothetical protein